MIEINIQPFPAVRSNRNTWTKSVKDYHDKMNELRMIIGNRKDEIIEKLLSGDYQIIFQFEMPKSWSKKKKLEMNGKHHKQKPDIDNVFKSFADTIFYGEDKDDKKIFNINAIKIWGTEGKINIL